MGAQIRNQQRSGKTGREEQEKWENTTLQSKRMCKKKDLNSHKESSQLSKLLAFLSCQMHHIKQWGNIPQTSMLWCRPNFPCQDSKYSILYEAQPSGYQTNKIPVTTTPKLWGNEAEGDPLTPYISYTYSTNQAQAHVFYEGCLLLRSNLKKQTKKRKLPLEEPSIAITFSKGRIKG